MRISLTRGLSKVVVLYGFVAWAFPGQARAQEETPFVRGEVNQDGFVDVGDAVTVLLHQFKPFFEAPCEKAVDVDDSGTIDITDAVWLLAYLFQDGPPPLPPFGRCGLDPTPDPVGCAETSCDDVEGTLIFSEIMASNFESLPDEDGDSSDWIEIHMPQSASVDSVDLGGWYLTGNPDLLTMWKFPDGITMRRGDFLVVFASGKDRSVADSELHTNFSMDKDGEYLALVAPDGLTVVDEFAPFYPEQLTDISYGLAQSTSALIAVGDQVLYHVPTAGDSGLGDSWADPGFSPNGWKTGTMGLGFSGIATEGFEVTYIKANVSGLNTFPGLGACNQLQIMRIIYATMGMKVRIDWDADTNDLIAMLPQDHATELDFRKDGGLVDPRSTGFTGDILFSTVDHTNLDMYSITIEARKKYA